MIDRLLPRQLDNAYRGHWLALGLFALFVAVKLIMAVNSLVNTREIMTGPDGIPLDQYGGGGAETALSLFRLMAWAQLMLAAVSLIALIRYRGMIPLLFLVMIVEHVGRRALLTVDPIARPEGSPIGSYINLALLAVLLIGFVLSIMGRRVPPAAGPR